VPASRLEVAENLDLDRRVAEAVELAADSSVQLVSVTKRELDQRTGGANHQGCALLGAPYSSATPADLLQRAADAAQPALVVALDGTQDPHNLGAVLRSAAAFGAHGVLIPARRAAQMGPAAWKASAGAAARLPVARVTNLVRALEDFKRSGLFVVGLAAADPSVGEGAAVNGPDSLELAEGPIVIVVGSEGGGLARLTRATCDLVVSVPMDGLTESLNASVAAGIVLYEVAKRRRSGHL
jgi:23S rRNA (guanosine2251-2'-O)-methyltransferase